MKKISVQPRLEWLTIIRGGAISLVVTGHLTLLSPEPVWLFIKDLIYSFHMPLFFVMSGFLYGYRHEDDKPMELIDKKLISLGIPYLFFCTSYILLNILLQPMVQTNTAVGISNLFQILYAPSAHYWFLYVLLFYFIITPVFEGMYKKCLTALQPYGSGKVHSHCSKKKQEGYIKNVSKLMVLLMIVSVLTDIVCTTTAYSFLGIWNQLIREYSAFLCGVLFGRRYEDLRTGFGRITTLCGKISICSRWQRLIKIWFLFILVFLISRIEGLPEQKGEGCRFLFAVFSFICKPLGIYAFSIFLLTVAENIIFRRFLLLMGEKSWYIYLLHTYFLAAARFVLSKVKISCVPVEIIFGCAAAISGSIAVSWIADHIKTVEFFFYPGKYLNIHFTDVNTKEEQEINGAEK